MSHREDGIQSVYIVEPDNQGWIIERLMRDIVEVLAQRRYAVSIGPPKGYNGETVILNSRYLTPFFDDRALVSSVFITHVDDRIREAELRRTFGVFNSFVCLSPHDAEFVAALKGGSEGVVGIELPMRDQVVRPFRIAMFSACYEDGRKNEKWLTEYFRLRPETHKMEFVLNFLGSGWENFSKGLADLDLNFEICRYSRKLEGEYQFYKERLADCDALVYLGFDGGAMSVYDAITSGMEILATDISYHRGLGDTVRLFGDKQGFFLELDRLFERQAARRRVVLQRSISTYVTRLVDHWHTIIDPTHLPSEISVGPNPDNIVSEFRDRYHSLGGSRLRSAGIRFFQYWKNK